MSPYAAQISIFKRIGAKNVSDIDFLETLIDSFYMLSLLYASHNFRTPKYSCCGDVCLIVELKKE